MWYIMLLGSLLRFLTKRVNSWRLKHRRHVGQLHVCSFRRHTLSIRHRVMLVLMWFRCYSTYHLFSALFNIISVSTVKEEQSKLYLKLKYFIIWPSIVHCHSMSYICETIPAAVGNIDGSSLEMYKPSKVQQQQYFSGHTIRFIHRLWLTIQVKSEILNVMLSDI